MLGILKAIGWVLLLSMYGAQLVNLCILKPDRKRIRDAIEEMWLKTEYGDAIAFVRAPIRFTRYLFEILLGTRVFSLRAFVRSSAFGFATLLSAMVLRFALPGGPTSSVMPWNLYDDNLSFAKSLVEKPETTSPGLPEQREFERRFVAANGHWLKAMYCVLMPATVAATYSVLAFLSVAMTRLLLLELDKADGFLTFAAILSFNTIFAIAAAVITTFLCAMFIFPVFLPFGYAILKLTPFSLVAVVLLFSVGSLAIWFSASAAFKTVVVFAIFPSLIISVILVFAASTYHFRRGIARCTGGVLLRLAEFDSGAFGWATTFFGAVAGIIALLALLFA